MPTIWTLLWLLYKIKYSNTVHKMYPDGRIKLERSTGMRNKLFILHSLNYVQSKPIYSDHLFEVKNGKKNR